MSIGTPEETAGRNLFLTASLLSSAFLGLQTIAAFTPSGRLWGIHAFGFIPPLHLAAAILLLGVVIFYSARGEPARLLSRTWPVGKKPVATLAVCWAVLSILVVVRRTAIPILGDGYTVLNNFRNTLEGVHPLSTSREPLGMAFFFTLAKAMRALGGWSSSDAILAGEILLLGLFIACAGRTARELFAGEGDGRRVAAFLFLLSPPYLQLFFGYVEVYAVVLAALSVTMMGAVLYHRGRIPFLLLPPVFALLVTVHYLGGLMIPLLIRLGIREWRSAGWRPIVTGLLLALPVLLVLPLWLGWNRVYPVPPHSHFLPISAISDSYTAYTLLAAAHLTEVANLLLLLGGGPIIAIVLGKGAPVPPDDRGLNRSLLLAALVPLLFVCAAKFDLGMAKDWDVSAPYFYPLALYGAYRLLSRGSSAVRAMCVVLAATILSSAAFIDLNADRDASLRRVKTLIDPAIMPQGGIYQTSIHLSAAYLERREVDSMVAVWRGFLDRYPDDLRGYQKLAKSIWEYGDTAYGSIMDVFERWAARAGGDTGVTRQYAQFSVLAGVASVNGGRTEEARARFSKAISLDPGYASAYFQMGLTYLRAGEADSALPWMKRTLVAAPGHVGALEALVGVYSMLGDSVETLRAYRAAAAAGSRTAVEYLSRIGGKF